MSACEIFMCACFFNAIVGPIAWDSALLNFLKTILKFAEPFELGYSFLFIKIKAENTGADLKGSSFFPKAKFFCLKTTHLGGENHASMP